MNKFALSVDEAAEAAGLGRSKIYEALGDGRLRAKKDGKRTLVLSDDLQAFLASLPEYRPAA